MRQFKTLLIAVALVFGATSMANAQSKVAHINSQELVKIMPQFKEAQNQLKELGKTYEAELTTLEKEAKGMADRFEKEASTKTDEENQKRFAEFQEVSRNIALYKQTAMREMSEKEIELMKPITEKARKTIHEVAKKKGFDYVLDSTTGGGVIMAEGYDLMPDVKKALGI